ncbi:transcriptional regulator [Candidatus Woesearchaeota archaeon]|nr:transcriptional regulator [Candidatus Woesearchaeota archaeon]
MKHPQEIEVWYTLPAIRRELSKAFIEEHKLNQKEVAAIMGVTEAAVSQYLKSKRANGVQFDRETTRKIHESARSIIKNKRAYMREVMGICDTIKENQTLCKVHAQFDPNVPKDCDLCFR